MKFLIPNNTTVFRLSIAQALMMSVNTMLLTSSAIIGFEMASDKSFATLPLAIQFLSAMFSAIPASFFMKKYGRRKGFILSSFMGFIGGLLALKALELQSFYLFCVSTVFFGIYVSFGSYYRFVAVEVSPDKERNTAISYVLMGGILAAFIGPNIAVHSKNLFDVAYYGSFIAVLILYALNLINFFYIDIPHQKPLKEDEKNARPMSQIIKQPVFIAALAVALFGYALMSLLMTATPLSMNLHHHQFSDIGFVIQWHVLGMFVPSLFTGHLINRWGFSVIASSGAALILVSVVINLSGFSLYYYWSSLLALGIGWNFLFISGTTKLTEAYNEAEKAKTQALNDFLILASVAFASLSAGYIQEHYGWINLNKSAIPFILLIFGLIYWLYRHPQNQRSKLDK